jgi:uncharacterized membrane protein YedE/YeeE
MKYIKYALLGILFGIVMTKSEVISWYRIQEMFRFQSFHMYGVIGSTVIIGIIGLQLIKRLNIKTATGQNIELRNKDKGFVRYLMGGIIFGLGWALSGACPGPMFTLVGAGYSVFIVVILSAVAGTYVYGLLRDKLPH